MKILCLIFSLLYFTHVFPQVKPDETNTGTTGTLTEYTGTTTITVDGTVLENLIINGSIKVQANNVIIKNCLIETGGYYGIQCNYDDSNGDRFANLLVEDCEIKDMQSAAIYGDNFTARRCNIWNSGADGIKPVSNFLIESCWLHKLGTISTAHADGVQMVNGSNGIMKWNNFDMPWDDPDYKNSQCIIMSTNVGAIGDVVIEENWINGGGYSVQIIDKGNGYGVPTNVSVINNLFGRDYEFGPQRTDSGIIWQCNVYEDNNEAIGGCDSTLSSDSLTHEQGIMVYPNPTSDYLKFNFSEEFTGTILMYNLIGKQVLSLTGENNLGDTMSVDCSKFPSGMYVVHMENNNKVFNTKVVVK